METKNAKFCMHCGMKLPMSAKFCPGCGMCLVNEDSSSKPQTGDTIVSNEKTRRQDVSGTASVGRLFRWFATLLFVEILMVSASTLIDMFDVRSYYNWGLSATVIFSMFLCAFLIWLNVAVCQRKEWARRAYIVLRFIMMLGFMCDVFADGDPIIGIMDILSTGLTWGYAIVGIIILILCFNKDVKSAFFREGPYDTRKCIAYVVGGGLVLLILGGICSRVMDVRDEDTRTNDYFEAAVSGSNTAKDALIDAYIKENNGQNVESIRETARTAVEQEIEARRNKKRSVMIGSKKSHLPFTARYGYRKILYLIFVLGVFPLYKWFMRNVAKVNE